MDKINGEGEGEEGGGFGWGEVEGWGEKAYNCNWITIKVLKKMETQLIKICEMKWKQLIGGKFIELPYKY